MASKIEIRRSMSAGDPRSAQGIQKISRDQQNQIKPILEERQQKMQALSLNQSITQDDRRSQAKSIKSDSNSRIEAVLNNDQKQKFEAMQEKKREKNSGRPQSPQQQRVRLLKYKGPCERPFCLHFLPNLSHGNTRSNCA